MLFAGNLIRHPAYDNVKYRVSGVLKKADIITESTFWMGVSPVVTPPMREYVVEKMFEFVKSK
jgi:CDP-6-deoxy-D-xylo-4-hexulose-3-dehydrase